MAPQSLSSLSLSTPSNPPQSSSKHGTVTCTPQLNPSNYLILEPKRSDTFTLSLSNVDTYHARVIDVTSSSSSLSSSSAPSTSCACLLIPPGRELEYLFTTYKGLKTVAKQIKCQRLIVITFIRQTPSPSTPSSSSSSSPSSSSSSNEELSQTEIQSVLSQFIKDVSKPLIGNTENTKVPFMSLGPLFTRSTIARGTMSGEGSNWFIEETPCPTNSDLFKVRRLFFESNPNVIQSECLVNVSTSKVDFTSLSFDYHYMISSGLALLPHTQNDTLTLTTDIGNNDNSDNSGNNVVVIGLGSGSLSMFLSSLLPKSNVLTIELDPSIVKIARENFQYVDTSDTALVSASASNEVKTTTLIDDGLNLTLPLNSTNFIVIDVDAKDPSLGMSCPPSSFIEPSYLKKIHSYLAVGGILAINCSARDVECKDSVVNAVGEVFGWSCVYIGGSSSETDGGGGGDDEGGADGEKDGDLNVVVFCIKNNNDGESQGQGQFVLPPPSILLNRLKNLVAIADVKGKGGEHILEELESKVIGVVKAKKKRDKEVKKKKRNKKKKKKEEGDGEGEMMGMGMDDCD